MRIGIVAGESSGDLLGAGLIQAIRSQVPDAEFEGIAGPHMVEAGCQALFPSEKLSIFGLVDAFAHYRELRGIRGQLRAHFIAQKPDVIVGIDVPDFNLGLLEQCHAAGIPTVQYVSPQVWAWRRYRVKKIARSVDRVLTLFPFEAAFYEEHQVPVTFVGHPFADKIPLATDRNAARLNLGLPESGPVVAILPGSRISEMKYLARVFLDTARWCHERNNTIHYVVPLANPMVREIFEACLQQTDADLPITVVDGQAREAMGAADAILMASGTATLEAMLIKRPMVVAYRMAWLNHLILRAWSNVKHFSLPNLLAGEGLVPECIQKDASPAHMGQFLLDYIEKPEVVQPLVERFTAIHHELRQNTDQRAAEAILEVVEQAAARQVN
jgi:lipid-A-disaccharide synthase